jgi:nitroimidazol reductase NimA-like FMN-containing flavoprotein (pyridoxamine 5'-phosphate oxidase superfamily)
MRTAADLARDDVVWIRGLELVTCWEFVEAEPVGRVGFNHRGQPIVLPVNHAVDGRTVIFRTEPGSALGDLAAGATVAFEVDGFSAEHQTGWSVLVVGDTERVDERGQRRIGSRLPRPWAPGERDEWVRIVPSRVTGRTICRRRRGDGRSCTTPDRLDRPRG